MQIDLMTFDWALFKRLAENGIVGDDDALMDNEEFTEEIDKSDYFSSLVGDSHRLYDDVHNDSSVLSDFDFSGKQELVEISDTLVNEMYEKADFSFDDTGVYAFSPQTVKKLSKLSELVNINDIQTAHKKWSNDEAAVIMGMNRFSLESEEYTFYIKNLISFIKLADSKQKAIVIHIG